MEYDVRRRTLTLGKHRCRRCNKGKQPERKNCKRCMGSGNGPRGGRGGCPICHGSGDFHDFDSMVACRFCGGDYKEADPETWGDRVPVSAIVMMPMKVTRVERANTWNENYLGLGYLYSAQDYGKASHMDDDELVGIVRAELVANPPQGSAVTGDVGTERRKVAANLLITVTHDGYSVRAEGLVTRVPPPMEPAVEAKKQRPIGEHVDTCPKCYCVHAEGDCA